eukprot:148071_1
MALRINMFTPFDWFPQGNRIVPRTDGTCPTTTKPNATALVQGDVAQIMENADGDGSYSTGRAYRLGLSALNPGTYDSLNTIRNGTQPFPLTFTLTNHPNHKLVLTYEANAGHRMEQCIYESLDTNRGLNMYFAVESTGDEIDIDSISFTSRTRNPIATTAAPQTTPITTQATSTNTADPCQPEVVATAAWSTSYLGITIHIANTNDLAQMQPLPKRIACDEIFDSETYHLIGDDATCRPNKHPNKHSNMISISVDLSSSSIIQLDDRITIQHNVVEFVCLGTNDVFADIIISEIDHAINATNPRIVISQQSTTIGVCDDLILDARGTTNLGGRDNALFEWQISFQNGSEEIYVGSYIVIASDTLIKDETYHIVLSVTNWYGATSTTTWDVYVSNQAIPTIFIHGVSNYSTINLNLNNFIDLFTTIVFDETCINQDSDSDLNYQIEWSVTQQMMDETNKAKFQRLTEFLQAQVFEDISVNALTLLEPCSIYMFTVHVQCIGDYDCDVQATHQLTFQCAPIQCKISATDIVLNDADPMIDLDFSIALDGDTFTYDPDNSDPNALQWLWHCVHDSQPCVDLLDSADASIVYMDLSRMTFAYNTSYSFRIDMIVSDATSASRDTCVDSLTMEIATRSNALVSHAVKPFIVTVTSITSDINRNDRLRLMGSVVNYPISAMSHIYYEWTELNGLLTADDIAQYKVTSADNALNLILEEGVLISGETYSFELSVTQYDAEHTMTGYGYSVPIGYGISVPISIYVLKQPKILSGSFQIEPSCNREYESIYDLLSISHSLSVSADGDHTPLLYIFGYEDTAVRYFHSLSVYEPFVSDIYLPVGTYSLFTHVIDTKSSQTSDTISCSVSLASYSVCITDFQSQIIDPFIQGHPLLTLHVTSTFVLQQSMNYMQYLQEYDQQDTCAEQSLHDILDIVYHTVSDLSDALCQYNALVLLLSETITLWMDVSMIDHSALDILTEILTHTLDPCAYISSDTFDVESLHVHEESIVTKIPKIYDGDTDVTNSISPIIIHPNYHHLLYSLSSSIIQFFSHVPSEPYIVLHHLVSDALYISQLVRVSLSIPYESAFTEFNDFAIYSVRVNNQNIDASVNDIDVFIPSSVTTAAGSDLFSSVDVLILGMNTSSNNVSTSIAPSNNDKCDDFEGTLADHSVSINLNTNASSLASNVNFTFECGGRSCDDSFECVWYNAQDEMWQNEGCSTEIHGDDTISCSCDHLTTFATIHNIHSICDNDYVSEWLQSDEWNGINLCLAVLFLIIFIAAVMEMYPFCALLRKRIKMDSYKAVFAMILIGITAFLYMIVCIQAYITKLSIHNDVAIKMYTLALLLPQVTLFMLFSQIFYTWFGLSHSFLSNVDQVRQRMRYLLYAVNVFIWCFLIVYYALICAEKDRIFEIAAYIWSGLLSITALFITIYSILVGRILYQAAMISQDQSFGQNDWEAVRRLLIINGFLTLYFMFQAFTTVHLAVNPNYQSVIYSTTYELMDAVCLLFIFWMYRGSLRYFKEQQLETELQPRSKTTQRTKNHTLAIRTRVISETVDDSQAVNAPITPHAKMAMPSGSPRILKVPSVSFESPESTKDRDGMVSIDVDGNAICLLHIPDQMDPNDVDATAVEKS